MSRVFGLDLRYYVKGGAEDPLALQQMSAAFERAGEQFQKFGEVAFPRVIKVLEKETAAQFKAEGRGPNRGKWAPLTPAYAKRKPAGLPILELTGRLRAAVTNSKSPFALRAYTATSMSFGTAGVPYASFHQTGTERKAAAPSAVFSLEAARETSRLGTVRMVDRPIFDFSDEFEGDIETATRQAARDVYKQSGVDKYASPAAVNAALDRAFDSAVARDGT